MRTKNKEHVVLFERCLKKKRMGTGSLLPLLTKSTHPFLFINSSLIKPNKENFSFLFFFLGKTLIFLCFCIIYNDAYHFVLKDEKRTETLLVPAKIFIGEEK